MWFPGGGPACTKAGDGLRLWHDQRAFVWRGTAPMARRLGYVLVLRRRPRWLACVGDGLNARQCADLNRDDPAAGNPRGRLPRAASPKWALRLRFSGGPMDEYRGGLGAVYEIELLEEARRMLFLFGERGKRFAPRAWWPVEPGWRHELGFTMADRGRVAKIRPPWPRNWSAHSPQPLGSV